MKIRARLATMDGLRMTRIDTSVSHSSSHDGFGPQCRVSIQARRDQWREQLPRGAPTPTPATPLKPSGPLAWASWNCQRFAPVRCPMAVHTRAVRSFVIVALCAPSVVVAQATTPTPPPNPTAVATTYGHAIPVPTAVATRRAGPITLDAKLDEDAWKAATPITEFTQTDPGEGKQPSQRTEVRFLFDDDALYIGAKMFDTAGAKGIMTRLVRRDGSLDSDFFQIVIDGYHDHLSRAFFEVNPAGSQSDYIGIGASCCDASWDPIWQAATHIDADGWTAEIRIPYSQLRFSRNPQQVWGLQVRRFIKRRDEEDDWSFWHKNEAGGPSRFGHLVGLHITRPSQGLELMPYASVKSSSLVSLSGTPFDTRGTPKPSTGLDLRDRVTSNLTLNATFNPDFGQVEVDPAVLNLSAFETFFPERRPFFIENANAFSYGNFSCFFCSNVSSLTMFYTRRIGRSPQLFPSGTYVDMPE